MLICIVNIQLASKPLASSLFWLASIVALWLNCVCQRSDPFFLLVILICCVSIWWSLVTTVTGRAGITQLPSPNPIRQSALVSRGKQFPLLTLCPANVLLRPVDALWNSQSAVWESCDHGKKLFKWSLVHICRVQIKGTVQQIYWKFWDYPFGLRPQTGLEKI